MPLSVAEPLLVATIVPVMSCPTMPAAGIDAVAWKERDDEPDELGTEEPVPVSAKATPGPKRTIVPSMAARA